MQATKKTISITDLKARLSECLRRVKHGEQWVVTERGKPIAVLGPSSDSVAELGQLAAEGAVQLGAGVLPASFWDLPAPEGKAESLLEAILEERERGW